MTTSLDLPTLDARARGLATHLFGRRALEELAALGDVGALAHALDRSGRLAVPIEPPLDVAAIEQAVRRTAARHLRVLATWSPGAPALEVFYAEQDRRSVRALVRGAIQGARAEARLAGLLPTPRLPERALVELAKEPTVGKLAAHLVLLRHPDAHALLALSLRAQPVLLDLERALARGWAERSRRAARAGDVGLVEHVRDRIDACNAQMALLLAGAARDVDPASCFLEGGRALGRARFVEAAQASTRLAAATAIERATAGADVAAFVHDGREDPSRIDRAALARALAKQHARARLDPLGSAPLVSFLLRLEAQSVDLQRIAWGASLGAPASIVASELVTPPWS